MKRKILALACPAMLAAIGAMGQESGVLVSNHVDETNWYLPDFQFTSPGFLYMINP